MKFPWLFLSLTFLILNTSSCSHPLENQGLVIHKVKVTDTQADITLGGQYHYAGLNPNLNPTGQLVLFLGGTGSDPGSYQALLKTALNLGHHVISLAYPNQVSMGQLLGNSLSDYGLARQEIVTGLDSSSFISIDQSNSILNRVLSLLTHLKTTYPTESWGGFITDLGEPKWENIIVAGYSQGAGHAAWIAQHHQVARLVMFSGVVDGRVSDPRESATWLTIPPSEWQTSFEKHRWFVSIHDGNYPAIRANMMTLATSPDDTNTTVQVDSANSFPPQARAFTTALLSGGVAHPSTCEDGATPLRDGTPIYEPVWKHLFKTW